MKFINHYKTSIPKDSNIANIIFYIIGLTLANILIFPFHTYEKSRKFAYKILGIAERIPTSFLKALFVGMFCHYISDYFTYDTLLTNILEKGEYKSEFTKMIDTCKNTAARTDIKKTIAEGFVVEDIAGSIDKFYTTYLYMAKAKQETQKRILTDYLFISNICQKVYESIVFF